MLILLIGPSGVGKSLLGEYASTKITNCKFYDLDLVVSPANKSPRETFDAEGRDKFFERSCRALENIEIECNAQICLVAIGAGTLVSHKSKGLLTKYTVIAICAPPEEVATRNPLGPNRDFTEFKNTEYSPHRLQLYQSASFQFQVSGLSKEQARQKFVRFLEKEVLKSLDAPRDR